MLVKCSIVDCSLLVVAVCRSTYCSLEIPLQLAVLMFQPPDHAPKCKAVLWGFLKKFIFQEGGGPCFAVGTKGLGEWKLFQAAQSHGQCFYDSRTASFDASTIPNESVVYEGDLSFRPVVIITHGYCSATLFEL
jgi:hypothetical protein